jgi:flagellar biosynthesis/type III secretory pathway ATPase
MAKDTMYVRRKLGANNIFEFIDFREHMDAEGEKIKMLAILKEDNKADIIKAVEILKEQIKEKVLEKEVIKFEKQIAMIEAYEEANPIQEVEVIVPSEKAITK